MRRERPHLPAVFHLLGNIVDARRAVCAASSGGYAALLPEWAAALAVFLVTLDGILTARVLLTTHDIDALTPRTLLRSKEGEPPDGSPS